MSHVTQITIGSMTLNAAQAPASEQNEVMSYISATVMERVFNLARNGIEQSTEKTLILIFMSMPQNVKQRVETILTGKVTVSGTNTRISVADFGGKMVEWNTLLAKLLEWNLSDFFIWLQNEIESEKTAAQQKA